MKLRPTVLFNLADNNSIYKLNPGALYCGLNLHSIYSEFLLKPQKALITSSKHLTYTPQISTNSFPCENIWHFLNVGLSEAPPSHKHTRT